MQQEAQQDTMNESTEDNMRTNAQAGPSSASSPYFSDQGLRKVHPYNHTYLTYAKQRWLGRELLEIFTTEFRDRSKGFYDWAISNGTVMVNGKIVDGSYVLQNGDLISNVVHRHEPPVLDGRLQVFHKDEASEVWVVEKKASMPIHATGRYMANTLLAILKDEHGLDAASTANRLDRLVSGVILVATSTAAARRLGADFGTPGRVQKEYVARVRGEFPIGDDGENGELICEQPLLTIDKQIGVNVVHPDGRPSKTIFTRISYDPKTDTSVVRCRPVTGRSHQLRVHLQWLGHPIANDPIYNNDVAWGKSNAKGGLWKNIERSHVLPAVPTPQSSSSTPSLDTETENEDVDTALAEDLQTKLTYDGSNQLERHEWKKRKKARHEAKKRVHEERQRALAKRETIDDTLGGGSQVSLIPQAVDAILHLRKVRDEEDNFARYRDMDRKPTSTTLDKPFEFSKTGLKTSSVSAKKGFRMMSKEERDQLAAQYAAEEAAQSNKEKDQDPLWYVAKDAKGEYCKACGIPLLPDPTMEMLQIWLHAIRYHTDEWDYSSPLPDWAREDWVAPALVQAQPDASNVE